MLPGPKTTRLRGWKSKDGGDMESMKNLTTGDTEGAEVTQSARREHKENVNYSITCHPVTPSPYPPISLSPHFPISPLLRPKRILFEERVEVGGFAMATDDAGFGDQSLALFGCQCAKGDCAL